MTPPVVPTPADPGLRPVCFVVMPYRVKEVGGPPREGVPARIDFDALWDRAIRPALERIGYQPVRGDVDPSGVILLEMMERLALADLVLADVSIPNGNAYYEIGIRHAARETDCVLMAADWSVPLFDLNQASAVRYPLPAERVDDVLAEQIATVLVAAIPRMRGVRTPYHALVRDASISEMRRGAFRDFADRMCAFQSGVREVRLQQTPDARAARLRTLLAGSAGAPMRLAEVATELVTLVRDELGWQEVEELVAELPAETRTLPFIEEQRILAVANGGDALRAVAELETLIRVHGGSPERYGILGGRHKRLWDAAVATRAGTGSTQRTPAERRHLENAIGAYERGMRLDFNAYYCASNLPLLLLARDGPGDRDRAHTIDRLVRLQCERAVAVGSADEWLAMTLLGVAVRLGDVAEVTRLADRIALEDTVRWKVESSWRDLCDGVSTLEDATLRTAVADALQAIEPSRLAVPTGEAQDRRTLRDPRRT